MNEELVKNNVDETEVQNVEVVKYKMRFLTANKKSGRDYSELYLAMLRSKVYDNNPLEIADVNTFYVSSSKLTDVKLAYNQEVQVEFTAPAFPGDKMKFLRFVK